MPKNELNDGIRIGVNVDVRNAQDAPTEGPEMSVAAFVVQNLLVAPMHCTVDFDDQLVFDVREVGDVGTERMLAAEVIAVRVSVSEALPQDRFGLGRFIAQASGRKLLANSRVRFLELRIPPPSAARCAASTSPASRGRIKKIIRGF